MSFSASHFIKRLLDYTRNSTGCFNFGAYVIQDPALRVFKALNESKHNVRYGSKTHSAFMDDNHAYIDKTFQKTCIKDYDLRMNRDCSSQREYPLGSGILFDCDNTLNPKYKKKIILYYAFRSKPLPGNQKGKTYLYMKFETFPYISIGHQKEAIDRYILKKQRGNDNRKPRREDEKKSSMKINSMLDVPIACQTFLASVSQEQAAKMLKNITDYDTYIRTQNEFFVPTQITGLLSSRKKIQGCV